MVWCSHCLHDLPNRHTDDSFICCRTCGKVLDDYTYLDRGWKVTPASRRLALAQGNKTIKDIASALSISRVGPVARDAFMYFKAVLDSKESFSSGSIGTHVAASCMYIALRNNDTPYLLIELSDYLRISVYALGVVFVTICRSVGLESYIRNPVDPSLFVHRFTKKLLGQKDNKTSIAALRIIANTKREMRARRDRTSKLFAVAMYIAAKGNGHKISKLEVIDAVNKVSRKKKLVDFKECVSFQWQQRSALLCEHKNSERAHFAHGLCEECNDVFMELYGTESTTKRMPKKRATKRMPKKRLSSGVDYDGCCNVEEGNENYFGDKETECK